MDCKKLIALFLATVMLLSLCACGAKDSGETKPQETTAPVGTQDTAGETNETTGEVTVTDMIGREVKLMPGDFKRVVCVGAGALRMYCYIGDVSLLCGVEDIDNTALEERPKMFDATARPYMLAYGETFQNLPSCGVGGPMAQAAEAEKILACGPDIVISEFEDVEKADALQEQLGVPVITLKAGAKGVFDPVFAGSMRLLGTLFDREAEAETLISFVEKEKAAIEERVAQIPEEEKPSVYICGLGNWGTANHLTTAENYVSFQIAGVKNVLSGLGMDGVGPIEEEKFIAEGENMDIMILDAAAVKNIKPLYAEDPHMFDTCKAWQNGEVYLEMAYNAYYTNFEICLINTWFIAKTVYPEAFADINMNQKTKEVTRAFLGADLTYAIFACPGSFGGYQKIDTATFFG